VTFALDRSTETLFIPVGKSGARLQQADAPGANLFTNSVVALDARSGTLKWWYQLVPNDDHDWDTTVVSLFKLGRQEARRNGGQGRRAARIAP